MVLTPFAGTTQAMPGSEDRGRGRARSLGASGMCLLLIQGIMQEAVALLLRRQFGGECRELGLLLLCGSLPTKILATGPMCSARLSSTALSTRGSHGAVEVACPGFAEACPLRRHPGSGPCWFGLRRTRRCRTRFCAHGHLISRFQIGSLAGSLGGVVGAVCAGRGTDASVARMLVGACSVR
jgi:hypothetical protein